MSRLGNSTVGKLLEMESFLWNIHRIFNYSMPHLSREALQEQQAEYIAYCSLKALDIWKSFKLHHPRFLLDPISSTTSSECLSSFLHYLYFNTLYSFRYPMGSNSASY